MPDLRWNSAYWTRHYDWSAKGEEWSSVWGLSSAQWFATILSRIRSFVPTGTLLEIAPGFGRWTRFLGSLCQRYYGVDISSTCTEACRARFSSKSHMEFFTNDGLSLAIIPDGSVDFAFSFNSLVHVDPGVLQSYATQLVAKLSSKGAAFIHHSNLAALTTTEETKRHGRDPNVSAELFQTYVRAANGEILRQEVVDWGGTMALDCLSLFARAGAYETASSFQTNSRFMEEALYVAEYVAPWDWGAEPSAIGHRKP